MTTAYIQNIVWCILRVKQNSKNVEGGGNRCLSDKLIDKLIITVFILLTELRNKCNSQLLDLMILRKQNENEK